MPAVEGEGRYHKTVLWVKTGDGPTGEPVVADPIQIMARWEQGRRYGVDPLGRVIMADHVVTVDREIPVGSLLWKGELTNVTGTAVLTPPIFQVQRTDIVPDVDCRAVEHTVGVTRFRNTVP